MPHSVSYHIESHSTYFFVMNVQSNSNTSSEVDADIYAALPTFYSQLEEAWIAAFTPVYPAPTTTRSYEEFET